MGLTPVHVLGKEGVEQERVHQPMRNWCVMSSHRAVSLHPELQVLVQRLCLLVNWGSSPSHLRPGAVGSMHSLQQVFPEWIAEWCAIMVSTCRHWFPSSVAAWAEIYDSQPGHYIRAAKFSLHKYSFQMTYPITFIRKFLREKISTSYQVKNVS